MTNYLRVEDEKRQLIMDRTFAKQAAIAGTPEYARLQDARRDYPTYAVTRRQIRKKPDQEHYKGLTYDYMRAYIAENVGKDTATDEEREAAVKEALDVLENKIFISKCHSNTQRYPAIRKWFLATYPEVKEVFKSAAA